MYKLITLLAIPVVLFFVLTGIRSKKPPAPAAKNITVAKGFALLELYTSEGCSSCPPADALLPEWEKMGPNVIPLSFHVDYWNRLGWKDRYSSEQFTQRQYAYAKKWELESVYTPQLVINGAHELTGSNGHDARALISQALDQKPEATLTVDSVTNNNTQLGFSVSIAGIYSASVLNIALVEKENTSSVTAGENRGRKLVHHNIVWAFKEMPAQKKISSFINIPAGLKGNCALVFFVQRNDNRLVTAATKRDLIVQ